MTVFFDRTVVIRSDPSFILNKFVGIEEFEENYGFWCYFFVENPSVSKLCVFNPIYDFV